MQSPLWIIRAAGVAFGVAIGCGGTANVVVPDAPFDAGSDGANGNETRAPDAGGVDVDATGGTKGDPCAKVDLVLVVDNSASMTEEQANLGLTFPKFVTSLNAFRTLAGAPLDWRIAVITTDIETPTDQGRFRRTAGSAAAPGCSPGPARPWLERADADGASAIVCRALVGTAGSSVERPLEALKLGLTARIKDGSNNAEGGSFLRPDALLAFIVVTDEDEGDVGTAIVMAGYVAALDTLKKTRSRWTGTVIAGVTDCLSPGFGEAREAKHLKEFVSLAGGNTGMTSICAGDLSPALTETLQRLDNACLTP